MSSWIRTAAAAPYFLTEDNEAWTPIGHNSAVSWPDLGGLFGRRGTAEAAAHLDMLRAHGVTCLRMMLEYCHREHRYLEQPVGTFKPRMVQYWDDLAGLCEERGIRLLLTPFDTFWMWRRWGRHPYNARNGGPCADRRRMLLCRGTREAIKNRLAFATERWGGSGAVFAWDLWNEIHPSYAEDSAECFADFVDDVGGFLRAHEERTHGRAHLQTLSVFTPHMSMDDRIADTVFRHPHLDFATTHFYEEGTIDDPRDTVAPAISAAKLTRTAIAECPPLRPFFDSEHGPIHTYKDRHLTLPEPFDDEYFRNIQWAHFASGAAGGSMRWPNRRPHVLTPGMHRAQLGLSRFLPLIEWRNFQRRPLRFESEHIIGCGDERQAVVWIVHPNAVGRNGTVDRRVAGRVRLGVPGLGEGEYRLTLWDMVEGEATRELRIAHDEKIEVAVKGDIAVAVRRVEGREG